jgi:Sigma-70, region 4
MPRLDDLPPDLRATLSLLVDRGKSYAQVAELLGIPESAVRDRAHAALDALAGAPGGAARASSPALAAPSGARASSRSEPAASGRGAASGAPGARQSAFGASAPLPVSRRGGALLLGGIAAVIAVVVVLLTSGGGGGSSSGASASTSTPAQTSPSGSTSKSSTSTGTSSSGSKARVTNQLTLTSPSPASKTIGIAEILAEGSQHAVYMAAEHLPPTHHFVYVLWLYNSPSNAEAIGKTTVSSTARMQAGALLPANATTFHQLLLTRETGERPSQPGPTVLSGAFSLGR